MPRRLLLPLLLLAALTACAAPVGIPVGAALTPESAAGRAVLAQATATAAVAAAFQADSAAAAEAADLARRQAEMEMARQAQALEADRMAAANAAARDLADTQARIIAASEAARVAREQADAAVMLARADAERKDSARLWDWRLSVGTRIAGAVLLLALAVWCVGWVGIAFARSFPRWLRAIADDRADRARHDAEMRRIERLQARVDVAAGLVYTDRGPARLPPVVVMEPEADAWARVDNDRAWDTAVCQFLESGHMLGSLAQDRMEREGVATRDAWDALTRWLVQAGVAVKEGRRGTRWADEWDIRRWRDHRDTDITLPYPPDPAPAVRPWGDGAQRAQPAHSSAQSAQPA